MSESKLKSSINSLVFSPMMQWVYFCLLIMSLSIFMGETPLLQKLWALTWGFISLFAYFDVAPKFVAIRQRDYANANGCLTSDNMQYETFDFIGKYIQRVSLEWQK